LWSYNLRYLKQNFPISHVGEIIIVTDKKTNQIVEGARIVVSNDGNDFVRRFSFAASMCEYDYLLVTLDDYYFVNRINERLFDDLFSLCTSNGMDYLKLRIRTKSFIEKDVAPLRKDIDKINTKIPYSIDLYPGIWKKQFVLKVCDGWKQSDREIWRFEAQLWKSQECQVSKSFAYTGKEIAFLDVIRKGKLIRKANRRLKKDGIDLTKSWKLMSVKETMTEDVRNWLGHHLPVTIKKMIKSYMHKRGKTFYSD
jgi:hypothetical protein